MTRERPEYCTDEMLEFLDALRESGVTNMFGAAPYVDEEFELGTKRSRDVLLYWMDTFSERHNITEKRKA